MVELDDGEQVQLTGYADRLELDADGNVVVVDLKTGRSKPSDKAGREPRPARPLPVRRRPRRRRRARRPTPGPAAPSWSSSACSTAATTAVVQPQDVQPEDGPDRTVLRERLAHTASLLRAESFPAVAGQHCRDCSFVPICPIKSAGSVTSQ